MSTAAMPSRPTLSEVVRQNIAAEAGRRGINQATLARRFGMSKATMSDRYRGRKPWTVDEVEQAAAMFGVPVDRLMSREWCAIQDSNLEPAGYCHGGGAVVLAFPGERVA